MGTYSARVTMQDLAEYPSAGHAKIFLRRVTSDLWRRSGGVHVPKTARMIRIADHASRCLRYRVVFNSAAWTGR